MSTLGKRLKLLRGKKTQQEIADLLEISRARYSHYENDHVQPDHELLQKMADLFDESTDYLLGRETKIITRSYGLSEDNQKLVDNFSKLSEGDQTIVLDLMERLKKEQL